VRRRRATVLAAAVVLVLVVVVVVLVTGGNGGSGKSQGPTTSAPSSSSAPSTTGAPTTAAHAASAITATTPVWSLAQPLSREIVLPGPGARVTVFGGLLASQATTAEVFTLDTSSGGTSTLAPLASGVHDAAGAILGGRVYLFGGGSPDTVATVQQYPIPATSTTTSGPAPAVTGQLPQTRSDCDAVRIGATVYVVGGYDGSAPDPSVLATTDGSQFSTAADLTVPVRYAAVAALGGDIYLFGGQAVEGSTAGQAVDDIQVVDPSRDSAAVVGHLPQPLAGASAVVLGGRIYIAGGVNDTSTAAATAQILAYQPSTRTAAPAGTLPVPTSYAAATVSGGRAWIIGGENGGSPMSSVEELALSDHARRAS